MRLQPLSLGHALLLQRLGSPFAGPRVADHERAGRGDLALMLLTCGRPWQQAGRLVNQRRGEWLLWWIGLRLRSMGAIVRTTDALSAYVVHAWTGPRVWLKVGGTAQEPAEALTTVCGAMKGLMGLSHDEALSTPLRQALWDVCLYLQGQGVLEIVDSGDAALLHAAQKMREEYGAAS